MKMLESSEVDVTATNERYKLRYMIQAPHFWSSATKITFVITCSWYQKNETTNSPIHEFKVIQNVFQSL